MNYSPIKFRPLFKHRIWGSDNLKKLYNKDLPDNEPIGESWELADLKNEVSIIDGGPFDGMSFREFLDINGPSIGFSDKQVAYPFGIFVKLLDANDDLSVQVHPDKEACKKFPGAQLKTECWYVLDAKENAAIYRGLKPGVGRDQLNQASLQGTVDELLVRYPVKKGDFHFLPAGTVHALGAGVVVAEIQTPSDTTFRLFDWNRVDKQGKSRQLHLEEALESSHYTFDTQPPTTQDTVQDSCAAKLNSLANNFGDAKLLASCPYFNVAHIDSKQMCRHSFELEIPVVLIALQGYGTITNQDAPDNGVDFVPGDTLLLPKMSNCTVEINKPAEFLISSLGEEKA